MTDQPPFRGRDRRRLAVALAYLRIGLHEGDDPLYDPWKLPLGRESPAPGAPDSLRSNSAAVPDEVARSTARSPEPDDQGLGQTSQQVRQGIVFPGWALVLLVSALLFAGTGAVLRWRVVRPRSSGVAESGRQTANHASAKRLDPPEPTSLGWPDAGRCIE